MLAYAFREVRRCGLHSGAADPLSGRLILLVVVSLLAAGITEPMLVVPLGWWSFALVVALPRQRELRDRPRERSRGGRRVAEREHALTSTR
jgi:hypothetical protein